MQEISLRRSLALIVAYTAAMFALRGFFMPAIGINELDPYRLDWRLLVGLAPMLLLTAGGFVAWGSVANPKRSWRQLGWHTDQLPRQVMLGVAGGLVGVLVLFPILLLMGASVSEFTELLLAPSWSHRLVFLMIGIAAAFIEESLFRGNLLGSLQQHMSRWSAIVLQAVIFAVYHLNFQWPSLLDKLLLGVVFALPQFFGKQRSLVGGAIAHGLTWVLLGSM
jgi:membrane protease YdiL (CAAX protease family)